MTQATRELLIKNAKGLHARAAARLTGVAAKHQAAAQLSYDGAEADARSMLGLLTLGAAKGARVALRAEGPDAEALAAAIAALVDDLFGEGE